MVVQFKKGTSSILFVDGKIAMDPKCCCKPDECGCKAGTVRDTYTMTVSGCTGIGGSTLGYTFDLSQFNGVYTVSRSFACHFRHDFTIMDTLGRQHGASCSLTVNGFGPQFENAAIGAAQNPEIGYDPTGYVSWRCIGDPDLECDDPNGCVLGPYELFNTGNRVGNLDVS